MKKYIVSILVASVFLIGAPFAVPKAMASDISIIDFINLLITIGVIAPDKIPAVNAYLTTLNNSVQTKGDITGPASLSVNEVGTWSITNKGNNTTYGVDWIGSSGFNVDTYQQGIVPNSQNSNTFTHSYSTSGIYTPQFYAKNNSTNTMIPLVDSGVEVRVGVPNAPIIYSISPTHGKVGTVVIVSGDNFTQYGNNVFLSLGELMGARGQVSNLTSTDGKTLSFVIPNIVFQPSEVATGSYITTKFGIYDINITNSNGSAYGKGNPIVFTVDN